MKKIFLLTGIGVIFISLLTTCSIEKRRYQPGYSVQWNNTKPEIQNNNSLQYQKLGGGGEIVPAGPPTADIRMDDAGVTESSSNSSINPLQSEGISNHSTGVLSEECDVIVLNNGREIRVKACEISWNKIRYRKCEETDGVIYTVEKSEVYRIKYRDGTNTIISTADPVESSQGSEKNQSGIFGILSFAAIISSGFLFIFGVGAPLFVLIPLAIILGAIGCGRKRKNRGLALFGLLLGSAAVIVIIVVTAFWLSSNGPIGHCFPAGTKITTADRGEINIETIRPDDLLLAYDFKEHRLIQTEVENLIMQKHTHLFKLTFDGGEITTTDDHPFWVGSKGWTSLNPGKSNKNYLQERPVSQLTIGDRLFLGAGNKFTELQNIQPIEKTQWTYTIELKAGDNFIANGLLVKTEQVVEKEGKPGPAF